MFKMCVHDREEGRGRGLLLLTSGCLARNLVRFVSVVGHLRCVTHLLLKITLVAIIYLFGPTTSNFIPLHNTDNIVACVFH